MSNLSSFSPFSSGGGGALKYQEFTSSGTFTPGATLVANGGQVWVQLVSGGASGAGGGSSGFAGGGGGAGGLKINPFTATSAQTVTIGAGGTGVSSSTDGNAGGTSSLEVFQLLAVVLVQP